MADTSSSTALVSTTISSTSSQNGVLQTVFEFLKPYALPAALVATMSFFAYKTMTLKKRRQAKKLAMLTLRTGTFFGSLFYLRDWYYKTDTESTLEEVAHLGRSIKRASIISFAVYGTLALFAHDFPADTPDEEE